MGDLPASLLRIVVDFEFGREVVLVGGGGWRLFGEAGL